MFMLRRRGSRTGPERDFYFLAVTERSDDGRRSYWAFTEPSWYRWVSGEDRGPPPPYGEIGEEYNSPVRDE